MDMPLSALGILEDAPLHFVDGCYFYRSCLDKTRDTSYMLGNGRLVFWKFQAMHRIYTQQVLDSTAFVYGLQGLFAQWSSHNPMYKAQAHTHKLYIPFLLCDHPSHRASPSIYKTH
jgi:hypothetical protein